MSDLVTGHPVPRLSRAAVVSLGVSALLVGFAIAPVFPIVVIGICCWWLYDDLVRDPNSRPGWLGWLALAIFTLAAAGVTAVVTIFDAHFDCGGTLGGFGEASDARLDQSCVDARQWRPIVSVTLALVVCGLAAFGVRRSEASQSPVSVALRTFGVSAAVIVAINVVLVVV